MHANSKADNDAYASASTSSNVNSVSSEFKISICYQIFVKLY